MTVECPNDLPIKINSKLPEYPVSGPMPTHNLGPDSQPDNLDYFPTLFFTVLVWKILFGQVLPQNPTNHALHSVIHRDQ